MIRPGCDLIMRDGVTFTPFMFFWAGGWQCVMQICQMSFRYLFLMEEESSKARKVEVAFGFRWNWKGKQEQMVLFLSTCRPASVLVVHIWTPVYWRAALHIRWQSPQSGIKNHGLRPHYLPTKLRQKVWWRNHRALSAVGEQRDKLCKNDPDSTASVYSFLNVCSRWVPDADAELADRCHSQNWSCSETDPAVQNTANR